MTSGDVAHGLGDRGSGVEDAGRCTHDVADAMAIGEAVDDLQHADGGWGGGRRWCATDVLGLLLGGSNGGRLRLGQRANAALAQPRQQRDEHLRGRPGVADGGMASRDRDAEPLAQPVEIIARQRRGRGARQHANVECAQGPPWQAGEARLALQDRDVVIDCVADDDGTGEEGVEGRLDAGEGRCGRDGRIGNAVDDGGVGRDRHAGVDELIEDAALVDAAVADLDRTDLEQAGGACIQAGGLGVECHGGERDQGRRGADGWHGSRRLVACKRVWPRFRVLPQASALIRGNRPKLEPQ